MNTRVQCLCSHLAETAAVAVILLLAANAPAQNLFVADYTANAIYEFTPGGAHNTFATNLHGPYGLAFNKAAILFEEDYSSNIIYEITASGTNFFAAGLDGPAGLAFDSADNLFVANQGHAFITEIAPNGNESTFFTNIFNILHNPTGLAFDSAGDLFVTSLLDVGNAVTGDIYEFTNYNGSLSTNPTIFASGGAPNGLAFNSAGNLFVANSLSNNITEITPQGAQTNFANVYNPQALAFDSKGNLFVVDGSGGNVVEIRANGTQSTFASGLSVPVGLAFQPVPQLQPVLTNGTFQVAVSMPSPYHSTVLQGSTNLLNNWTAIFTNTPPFTFTDSAAPAFPHRFYRAFLGP